MIRWAFVGVFLAWMVTGCGDEDTPQGADQDASGEVGPDAVEDAGTPDSGPAPDASEDVTPDAPPDVPDTSVDAADAGPQDTTPDSAEDVTDDAGADTAEDTDPSPDVVDEGDMSPDSGFDPGDFPAFPEILRSGIWLIGWHGGPEHFSWVRFDFIDATRGSIEVRDPQVDINLPLFGCDGTGLFIADPNNNELVIQAPTCREGVGDLRLQWGDPAAPGEVVPRAQAAIPLRDLDQERSFQAYLHPLEMCNREFTRCENPFVGE